MIAEIIPSSFFATQSEWVLWTIAVVAIVMLVYGADRVVGAAARLAAALGLSKVIIGATVVSLGTTSPEAAVSVNAAFQGNPGLALGNGIGSIICDTALIFGMCCLMTRLPKNRFVLNRHGWLQFGAGLLLTVTAFGLWAISGDIENVYIPRWVGFIFVALLIGYLYVSVKWSREHPEIIPDEAQAAEPQTNVKSKALMNLLILLVGLLLVIGGSELLIGSMRDICERHDVPDAIIAVTFVAFGTSLPELVTALTAIARGHGGLLVGNVIGADILNVLFVIGASASAVPLKVHAYFFYLMIPVMMAVLILLRVYILMPGSTFKRWYGIPLVLIYVVFVILAVSLGVTH